METTKIQVFVEKRSDDFMAEVFIDGKKVAWDCGRNKAEAIGHALVTCQREL